MRRQMPQEGGIRPRQGELYRTAIQLAHILHRIGKLQTVEVGEITAVDVVPRMVAVKNALEGKDHVIRIEFTGRLKPRRALEADVVAQAKTVGGTVVQHLPALSQFRHQAIGIGIHIQQAVIELGGEGIDDQAAARLLRVEGVDLPTYAVDKAAVANIRALCQLRRGKRLAA